MAAAVGPGVAFSIVTDRGFAIGLCSHRHERLGPLVWLAEGFWDDEPLVEDVATVSNWRWCVFFPLGSALRTRTVARIGRVDIPPALVPFPVLRSGQVGHAWYRSGNGEFRVPLVATDDRDLPIAMSVNEVRLKEMLITDWMPAQRW